MNMLGSMEFSNNYIFKSFFHYSIFFLRARKSFNANFKLNFPYYLRPKSEFSDFEAKIARTTAESKASFLRNLNNRVFGKKVSIQASKGYGQPVRDYEISVTSTSLDYFYDRYVVILRDDDDKEYFLKPGFKITILGQGEPLKVEKPKEPKSAEPGTKATTKGGEDAIKNATPIPQQQYVAQPQQQKQA